MRSSTAAAALVALASQAYAQLPSSAPACVASCFAAKLSEAPSYYGTTDIATLCQIPTFVSAFSTCLGDHCTSAEQTEGLVLGAEVSTRQVQSVLKAKHWRSKC